MRTFVVGFALIVLAIGCSKAPPVDEIGAAAKVPQEKQAKADLVPRGGPFGLAMGMTVEEVKELIGKSPASNYRTLYIFESVPKPYGQLKSYSLLFGRTTGLCKISGDTGPIATNRFGTGLTEAFSKIESAISSKYGQPSTRIDRLLPGSLWDEPEDWTMGLLKEDRALATYWGADQHPVSNEIESIAVSASASSTDSGSVSLSYDFGNIQKCLDEIKKEDEASL